MTGTNATGALGNTSCLVGTAKQVAEAILKYYRLGVDSFLIRGFDPLTDTRSSSVESSSRASRPAPSRSTASKPLNDTRIVHADLEITMRRAWHALAAFMLGMHGAVTGIPALPQPRAGHPLPSGSLYRFRRAERRTRFRRVQPLLHRCGDDDSAPETR